MIAVSRWFFVMVTISSYITNLVIFNSPPTEKEKIHDVWDLAGQNRVKYGTVQGGFFQSKDICFPNRK